MVGIKIPSEGNQATSKLSPLDRYRKHTERKISEVLAAIGNVPAGCSVAVTGSYGRCEAGAESDFDFFLLSKDGLLAEAEKFRPQVEKAVEKVIGKQPSEDGPFSAAIDENKLLTNIGGNNERNEDITRRILLLIEGRPIAGNDIFDEIRSAVLRRYISDQISTHQLGLFFLNDLIRYYRTMCVDFEYKTVEKGKDWGIRNIKLTFSRKMIYFSGIIIAAEMAQRTYREKIEIAETLIKLPPLERIVQVCGSSADRAVSAYLKFLERIQDENVRRMLEATPSDREKHCEDFKRFKNDGHYFTWHLMSALRTTYDQTHPIHKCLIL